MKPLLPPPESQSRQDWRWQMRHRLRDVGLAADLLGLDCCSDALRHRVAQAYPCAVTPYYSSLAEQRDALDPIVRQWLPDPAELSRVAPGQPDPLAEDGHSPLPGLIHRYADRALLVMSNVCAVYCRHCLRKRRWGARPSALSRQDLARVLGYVAEHASIREVILSGGDPLLLPLDLLDWTLARILALPNVDAVRIGSRLPVVLPQRLTREFCNRLGRHGPVWLATQFNHPLELTAEATTACAHLTKAGIPVVNQTVLLRGVNDRPEVLTALCSGLVRMRVKPYYLFHGDPVTGAMHFRTGLDCGLGLIADLERTASGLAIPTFAFDLPEGRGKVRLHPDNRRGTDDRGDPVFADPRGASASYPDGSAD